MFGVWRTFAILAMVAVLLSACNEGSWSPTFLAPRNGPSPDANRQATKESARERCQRRMTCGRNRSIEFRPNPMLAAQCVRVREE